MNRNRFHFVWLFLALLSFTVTGCSDSKTSQSSLDPTQIDLGEEDHDHEHEHDHDHDGEKPSDGLAFELDRSADKLSGAWLFFLTEQQNEVPLGLVVVHPVDQKSPSEDKMKAEFLQTTKVGGKIESGKSTANLDTVEMQYTKDGQFHVFMGKLHEGVVFGNVLTGQGTCTMARMVRPKEQLSAEPEVSLVEGVIELSEIIQAGGDWDKLVEFINAHPESPMILNAFYTLSSQAGPRHASSEQIKQLFELIDDKASLWGSRLTQYSRLNTFIQLINLYRYPEFMQSVYDSLVGKFTEPMWEGQTTYLLDSVKKELEHSKLVEELRQSQQDQREKLLATLSEKLQQDRFNFNLLRSTADALAELDEKEKALEWYLDFCAVPGLESFYLNQFQLFAPDAVPTITKLDELWNEVHGSEDGLEEAMDENFQELMATYNLPEAKSPEENGKNVLVESFTGTACPPCVAADLACSRLGHLLPSDRVMFLQYHVHVPAADPLTTEGSAGRYHYYHAEGTPMLGRRAPEAFQNLLDMTGLDEPIPDLIVESQIIFMGLLDEHLQPMPGLFALLDHIAGLPLPIAVATSSHRDYVEDVLGRFDLRSYFVATCTSEDVEPDPRKLS